MKEIFTLNLRKADEEYSKSKTKKNKEKDDEESNASIELNNLGEDDSLEEELFENSATNFSAHSETFLDKTTGSLSYEKSK